jgi:DNA-binding MarR family transcriptional regulator
MSTSTSTDDTIRELMRLMPRLVGRAKRLPVPEPLQSLELAPRHLSLLSYLQFDGALTVGELAERLELAPTTVSLIVGELSRKGVVVRHEDEADRRRRIVEISPKSRRAISNWLSPGARAWRKALAPLTSAQQAIFVATLRAYEAAAIDERR